MRKRFILVVEDQTSVEAEGFKNYLRLNYPGIGWWHRIGGLWLITDNKGRFTATDLRDVAMKIFVSHPKLIVIELNQDGDTWAGCAPESVLNETFEWLHGGGGNWKRE